MQKKNKNKIPMEFFMWGAFMLGCFWQLIGVKIKDNIAWTLILIFCLITFWSALLSWMRKEMGVK